MKFLGLLFVVFMLSPATLFAQSNDSGLWVKNAEIQIGDGTTIKGDVVVDATGKIVEVGKSVKKPAGKVREIDAGGKIVTPGLIDPNTVLGLVEIWAVDSTSDQTPGDADREKDFVQSGFLAADGFNPNSVAIPITREGGVTSVVVSPSGKLVSGQSAWVDLATDTKMHATIARRSIAMNVQLGERTNRMLKSSRGSALLMLRETFDDAQFFAKNGRLFDEKRTDRNAVSRLDLLALNTIVKNKQPVVFGVNRSIDIIKALEFSERYGLRPIISGGTEAWMVTKELKEANAAVIVDPMSNLPSTFDNLGSRSDNAALLHKAGVPVMLSTFDAHNVRNLRFQAGNAVRDGLPPAAALSAITKNVADAFDMKAYGTLEKGKIGNLVIWSGDPFEPASHVEHLYINGKEVSTENRQSKLFERYRKLDRRAAPADLKTETEEKETSQNKEEK